MRLDLFSLKLLIVCNTAKPFIKLIGLDGNGFILLLKRINKSQFKRPGELLWVTCDDDIEVLLLFKSIIKLEQAV